VRLETRSQAALFETTGGVYGQNEIECAVSLWMLRLDSELVF
jgi:hypothetical protein